MRVNFSSKTISPCVRNAARPLLVVAVDVAEDNGIGEGKQRSEGDVEVRREVGGGRRRNVNVGDMEFISGEGDFDDEGFGGAVVDWRSDLGEVDGVVDECDESPATTNSVLPNGSEAWEGRKTRALTKLCLLDASNEDIVP